MNWELIGWAALAISGVLISAGFFVGRAAVPSGATGSVVDAEQAHPLHAWLEIAWPVFFIASMGMLTLKEVMGFSSVLFLAIVITGVIWGTDTLFFRKKRLAGEPVVVEMARSFFPVILIVFVLRSFLYEPFKIPSESMLPTLQVGDFILVNKFTYGVRIPVINKRIVETGSPKRGDVMVFRYPKDPTKDFIKRVVGLPGDRVSYKQKRLMINDQPASVESLGTTTEIDKRLGFRRFETFKEKLGEKPHAVMMDPDTPGVRLGGVQSFQNRENCAYNNDGVVCTVPEGHFFMMGDNRDNSDDSRYWGFVPEENIVGKAVLIWMNFGAFKRIGTSIE